MKKIHYSILISTFYFFSISSQHFVLISAPGSGKGIFSQYMIKYHGYVQICPGDIFRKEILQQTELGKMIAPTVEAGDYVNEEIVCMLMQRYIEDALNQNKQFILDGFPRSENSLQFLLTFLVEKKMVDKISFLQLQTPDNVCKQRILGRYVCNACGQVDNKVQMKVNNNPKCSSCGETLALRPGDKETVIDKRLQHFHNTVEPLLEKLQHNGYLIKKINSDQELSTLKRIYNEIIS